jgi:hypothetical protein
MAFRLLLDLSPSAESESETGGDGFKTRNRLKERALRRAPKPALSLVRFLPVQDTAKAYGVSN